MEQTADKNNFVIPNELILIPNQKPENVFTQNHFINVHPLFPFPQREAAKLCGMPCSTFSKRWREASLGSPWPHRAVSRCDREIEITIRNLESAQGTAKEELSARLSLLLRKRQENWKPVFIRIK